MTDNNQTARVPMASEMVLAVEWKRPYADLDVYRLYVGPFYAGEVARTTDGWKALSPFSASVMSYRTKEAAQIVIEAEVEMS